MNTNWSQNKIFSEMCTYWLGGERCAPREQCRNKKKKKQQNLKSAFGRITAGHQNSDSKRNPFQLLGDTSRPGTGAWKAGKALETKPGIGLSTPFLWPFEQILHSAWDAVSLPSHIVSFLNTPAGVLVKNAQMCVRVCLCVWTETRRETTERRELPHLSPVGS